MSEWYPRDRKRTKGRQIKLWEDVFKIAVGPEWLRIAGDREFVEGQWPPFNYLCKIHRPSKKLNAIYNMLMDYCIYIVFV